MTSESEDNNDALIDAFTIDEWPNWLGMLRELLLMLSPAQRKLLLESLPMEEGAAGEDPSSRSPPGDVGG